MLNSTDRGKICERIEKKLERLNEDMVFLEEECKPIAPENSIGRVSRMDAINNKSVSEAALRQAKDTKQRLIEALQNIHAPDFGMCNKCKLQIELQRLLVMPESRRCTKCA